MSQADTRLSPRFLLSELRLIAVRRRNQAGLAALAAVPVILAAAMKLTVPDAGRGPGQGPDFFSQITGNGYFVALAALGVELTLFLPIAVAMLAGDAVAGEANQGTLRYLLTVPVARTRLLAIKYAGILMGAFLAPLVVATSGLLAGFLLFGAGDVTTLSGTRIGLATALLRLLVICLYLGVCLAALGAVGLFLSTLTEQPMGATIALTMLTVASFVLGQIPQLDWLHPYLLTQHWRDFGELLREPVAWEALIPGLTSAGAYILVFLSAAWARFSGRDVTS
ncbi:ABC transporter permease [Pseudosporangium ferrugineum]|uniref:ABC-2 type transport system permease protein n=1 Tax=Pseudosporangium ferrugineum TaxID=439699 RepID=A0A2T0SFU0_9ACTN|nr:ABC transporter permease [Pseudosporangium ferrugineum]PRY32281.1 ABC-2 type transport system permease protein [Pseudosporangium ferrugineum]